MTKKKKIYARTCKIRQERNFFFSQDKTGGESCLYCCDPERYVNSRISQGFKLKSRRGLAAKGIGVSYMLTAGREKQIRMYKRRGDYPEGDHTDLSIR